MMQFFVWLSIGILVGVLCSLATMSALNWRDSEKNPYEDDDHGDDYIKGDDEKNDDDQ